jgi:hypothetical protein
VQTLYTAVISHGFLCSQQSRWALSSATTCSPYNTQNREVQAMVVNDMHIIVQQFFGAQAAHHKCLLA